MLIVMCGLPGVGKSALADDLARLRGWTVLSVDPVEAALWAAGIDDAQPTGLAAYVVVEALAEHALGLDQTVIVDAVNDAPEARAQWIGLAERFEIRPIWVEVRCSDARTHRERLMSRRRQLPRRMEPSWESLAPRRAALAAWTADRLVVDSLDPRAVNLTRVAAVVDAAC